VPGAECVAGSVALLLPSPLYALGVGLAALVRSARKAARSRGYCWRDRQARSVIVGQLSGRVGRHIRFTCHMLEDWLAEQAKL
jgi:hypothetical protein